MQTWGQLFQVLGTVIVLGAIGGWLVARALGI
jgi:hypothetical protein